MLVSITRIAAAFLVILIAYWCYCLVVVPWIEPRIEYAPESLTGDAIQNGPRGQEELARLFPPGAWELESRKVIETPQGKLLFKDYKPMDDGRIRIEPCTLIFYTSSDGKAEKGRPIVMRTPQGALLQFDQPLDLARAKIGRLIGGRLLGEVRIHSLETKPGEGDDLEILTNNVQLAEDHVKTHNAVRFRYGKNFGSGRDMKISLIPSPSSGAEAGGPMFDGVRKLELFHVDNIRLYASGKSMFSDAPSTAGARKKPKADEPIDVTCAGPYEFDFEENVASFEEQVVVTHQIQGGASDRLTCDRLEIFFAPRESIGEPGAEPTAETAAESIQTRSVPLAGLTVHRLVATGSPAVLTSTSRATTARGEHLEYDFKTGQIYLEDRHKVMLQSPHQYVEAVKLRYEMAPEGRIGRVWADGPGRFDGSLRPEGGRRVLAAWRQRLRLQPHDGVHVLSLIDGASIKMSQSGGFSAQEIHIWLKEITKPGDAVKDGDADSEKPETDVVPDRMLALRNVEIDSERLTGKTKRLEAWFRYADPVALSGAASLSSMATRRLGEPLPASVRLTSMKQPVMGPPPVRPRSQFAPRGAPTGAARRAPTGTILPPGARAGFAPRGAARGAGPSMSNSPAGNAPRASSTVGSSQPVKPAPSPKKFDLNGDLVRVQLVQRPGVDPEIEAVAIDGHVHFRELQPQQSAEPPLDILGETLRITGAEQAKAVVRVFGSPAQVSARGMTMSGSNVQLDRGANRMWIEGAGNMVLPPKKSADGMGAKAPVHINWQDGMEFDGQVVRFRRDVRTRMREWDKEGGWTDTSSFGDTLDATVSKFVDFSQDEQPEDVELRRLVYDGGVFVQSYGHNRQGQRTAWDRLEAPNISVDQLSGEIVSQGAGRIRSVRLGGANPLAQTAASPQRPSPQRTSPPADPRKPPEITYTRVIYQRGITGNLHQREIVFRDQVETVHGPVPRWDMELDGDRPEDLGERGVAVTCDELSLYEMGPWVTNRRRAIELLAKGNAVVEGKSFNAQADRLTYAEAKDLVVLEGDGRSNAELWRQLEVGGERSYAAARKILYWKGENRFEVDDARFLDLTQLGAP
ncbi:MAG: hypothetical protein RIC55_10765 [Pirellulaceae bacterium]